MGYKLEKCQMLCLCEGKGVSAVLKCVFTKKAYHDHSNDRKIDVHILVAITRDYLEERKGKHM